MVLLLHFLSMLLPLCLFSVSVLISFLFYAVCFPLVSPQNCRSIVNVLVNESIALCIINSVGVMRQTLHSIIVGFLFSEGAQC